jgi:hypothetical protein
VSEDNFVYSLVANVNNSDSDGTVTYNESLANFPGNLRVSPELIRHDQLLLQAM